MSANGMAPPRVLKDCSASVARGEVVVVCGPSGSGKSTLIKCANGLEPFQAGKITVDGVSVGDKVDRPAETAGPHRHGLSKLRALSAYDGHRQSRLAQCRVLKRSRAEAEARAAVLLERVGMGKPRQAVPGQSFRWAAAARRHRPRTGHGSDRHAVRRTDIRARSGDDQ